MHCDESQNLYSKLFEAAKESGIVVKCDDDKTHQDKMVRRFIFNQFTKRFEQIINNEFEYNINSLSTIIAFQENITGFDAYKGECEIHIERAMYGELSVQKLKDIMRDMVFATYGKVFDGYELILIPLAVREIYDKIVKDRKDDTISWSNIEYMDIGRLISLYKKTFELSDKL